MLFLGLGQLGQRGHRVIAERADRGAGEGGEALGETVAHALQAAGDLVTQGPRAARGLVPRVARGDLQLLTGRRDLVAEVEIGPLPGFLQFGQRPLHACVLGAPLQVEAAQGHHGDDEEGGDAAHHADQDADEQVIRHVSASPLRADHIRDAGKFLGDARRAPLRVRPSS